MNPPMKLYWDQFLSLFLQFCHFFFFISYFPLFHYFPYFYFFLFFCFPSSFLFFLPVSFLLLPFSLSSFISAILTFLASVSTALYILLSILLSLLLLFSSQSQDCGKLAITFPRLRFTSILLSHLSLFFLYASNNKYSLLQYLQLASPC